MTKRETDFEFILREFLGENSPVQLVCHQHKINSHRKLRSKWKDIYNLEYTDSTTGNKAKLSGDDLYEIRAIQPFINSLRNESGPFVDITKYTRVDFENYLNHTYDPEHPTKYDINLACISLEHELDKINMEDLVEWYQDRAYVHILNELLDAASWVNEEIIFALEENNVTTLPALLEYIHTPGLILSLRWTDRNDGNTEKMLREEQYEALLALYSYFNCLQSAYGPIIADGVFNIFATTRENFRDFIVGSFDASKPIFYNADGTLLEERGITGLELSSLKQKFRYGGNDNSTRHRLPIPTTSDKELWSNYFLHSSRYFEDYTSSISHLHWEEINWPSRDYDQCNSNYISRVLSLPLPTFVKYPRPDETPAFNDGINCNSALGVGIKGGGINVRESSLHVNGETSPGEQTTTNGTTQGEITDITVNRTPYRRIVNKDIRMWTSRSSDQLSSRSNNDRRDGKTRDNWEAITLRALLTNRVSKYVMYAVSSCVLLRIGSGWLGLWKGLPIKAFSIMELSPW